MVVADVVGDVVSAEVVVGDAAWVGVVVIVDVSISVVNGFAVFDVIDTVDVGSVILVREIVLVVMFGATVVVLTSEQLRCTPAHISVIKPNIYMKRWNRRFSPKYDKTT